MPSTDRLSNIARARVSAVVLDEASGRERAATEVFNKVDADGEMGCHGAWSRSVTSASGWRKPVAKAQAAPRARART